MKLLVSKKNNASLIIRFFLALNEELRKEGSSMFRTW